MLSAGARGTCSQISENSVSLYDTTATTSYMLTDRHLCGVGGDYVVYHLLDSRPGRHFIKCVIKKREITDCGNQVLVDSRPEAKRRGREECRGRMAQSTL